MDKFPQTKLQEVYNRFLSKITSYEYLDYTSEELFIELEENLKSVLAKYIIDMDLKIKGEYFNRELKNIEIEILTHGLIAEWIQPKMNNIDWLEQNLKSSEYNTISEANQLNSIKKLYNDTKSEMEYWMNRYSHICMQ